MQHTTAKLLNKVTGTYWYKRCDVPICSVLLLHNKATPILRQIHWATVEQRPYSPHFLPSNCFLFGPLKVALGGRFPNNKEVEEFECNWL